MAAKKITTEKRVKYRLPRLPGANADQDQYTKCLVEYLTLDGLQ